MSKNKIKKLINKKYCHELDLLIKIEKESLVIFILN